MDRQARIAADGLTEEPLEFYYPQEAYGFMSNFSAHPVVMLHPFTGRLAEYKTTEHRFQAMKATTLEDHELVRVASRASDTKDAGRQIYLRDGWGQNYGDLCWFVMVEALMAKVDQHPKLLKILLDTGTRAIWEDSPTDDIWGIRYQDNYSGKNLLGRAWMYVRSVHS